MVDNQFELILVFLCKLECIKDNSFNRYYNYVRLKLPHFLILSSNFEVITLKYWIMCQLWTLGKNIKNRNTCLKFFL